MIGTIPIFSAIGRAYLTHALISCALCSSVLLQRSAAIVTISPSVRVNSVTLVRSSLNRASRHDSCCVGVGSAAGPLRRSCGNVRQPNGVLTYRIGGNQAQRRPWANKEWFSAAKHERAEI